MPKRPTARTPRRHITLLLVAIVLAGAARGVSAQEADDGTTEAVIRDLYVAVRDEILAAARMVPAAEYDYRPTPEVRTFGELVAHIADGQYFFCAAARNVPNPNEPNHRAGVVAGESREATLRGKAAILAAAEAALSFCDAAYVQGLEAGLGSAMTVGMRGQPRARALLLGIFHMSRHYGNMITYMRELGQVPPGSGP